MKIAAPVLMVLLSAGIATAAAQNSGTNQPNTSPGNDQGASAYGNGTYNAGAQPGSPASNNAGTTANDKAPGPGSGINGNSNPAASGNASGARNSNAAAGSAGGNNNSTAPSTTNPGNGNSPSSAPPGSSGSNTGAPRRGRLLPPQPAAEASMVLAEANPPQKAETNPQAPPAPQSNAGQTSTVPPPTKPANAGSAPTPPGNSPAESDPAENAALQGRIQQALGNEPTLSSSHVSVHVNDNMIELSGTVASGKDKLTADRIAESFNGNRKFDDNKLLVIGQAPATPATQPK